MSADAVAGWVDDQVAAEFPELRLWTLPAAAAWGRSPDEVRERLRMVANRTHGADAIELRRQPVPHAYRVFFRHIGIDPDERPTPAEAAVLDRLFHGGHPSRGVVEDARTLAVMETGVAVWALDASRLDGPPGVRLAVDGDRLGRGDDAAAVAPGRMVVADASSALAELFGDIPAPHAPGRDTTAILLFTVQVAGVPQLYVEEALWTCAEILDTPS